MARVSTDDDARRQKFIWLGTPDMEWPFEASGTAWIMALILCPSLVVLVFLLLPRFLFELFLPGPAAFLAAGFVALVVVVGGGVLVTRRVGRVVSPVRPLRHHVATLIGEVHAPREEPPTERVLRPGRGLFLEDEGAARLVVFPHFID